MSTPRTTLAKNILRVALVVAVLGLVGYVAIHVLHRSALIRRAHEQAAKDSAEVFQKVDERLAKLLPISSDLAARFADPSIGEEALVKILKDTIDANPDLNQVGVAFAP